MISDITFDQIHDKYLYAQYGDFKVVMMKDSGYINVSKLCRDADKDFYAWKRNAHSKELIAAVVNQEALESIFPPARCIVNVITHNQSEKDRLINGAYCHPLLLPHIASWISPAFALKVGKIVNTFFINK